MSRNYDNWERLVRAVLRRQHDWELALSHSRHNSSISSISSSFGPVSQFDFDKNIIPQPNITGLHAYHSRYMYDMNEGWRMDIREEQETLNSSNYMSFSLDPRTGKNCFLVGATKRELITDAHTNYLSKSRFSREVMPRDLPNFYICCSMAKQMLSPETLYAAYIVFETSGNETTLHTANSTLKINNWYGNFCEKPVECRIQFRRSEDRSDGWKEIELGTFFVHEGIEGMVEVHVQNFTGPQ